MNLNSVPLLTIFSAVTLIVFGRFHEYQSDTNRRVRNTAVNTEVTMPMASVTAKPFTGPVPIT